MTTYRTMFRYIFVVSKQVALPYKCVIWGEATSINFLFSPDCSTHGFDRYKRTWNLVLKSLRKPGNWFEKKCGNHVYRAWHSHSVLNEWFHWKKKFFMILMPETWDLWTVWVIWTFEPFDLWPLNYYPHLENLHSCLGHCLEIVYCNYFIFVWQINLIWYMSTVWIFWHFDLRPWNYESKVFAGSWKFLAILQFSDNP